MDVLLQLPQPPEPGPHRSRLLEYFVGRTDYRANAPRWHAVGDARRHKSAPRCTVRIGRRASRTAFPRWSVRNDNLVTIVPLLCASTAVMWR
ncbi:hypothetical protein CCL12_01535 [Pseudomonas syringae]|nr:hypothetical protein CCL12_29155 [Pseudomonas syringae]PBP36905.1 hypothetical protein CCL12_01535 [Pseudomonas syringae]PBP62095.1 hypothetical protein CCL18_01970 [Pseudomonas syringae]TRN62071.1 DUF1534 domain-containing protein [Pseudomonas syringae]